MVHRMNEAKCGENYKIYHKYFICPISMFLSLFLPMKFMNFPTATKLYMEMQRTSKNHFQFFKKTDDHEMYRLCWTWYRVSSHVNINTYHTLKCVSFQIHPKMLVHPFWRNKTRNMAAVIALICWYAFALCSVDYMQHALCPMHHTQIRNLLKLKYLRYYSNSEEFRYWTKKATKKKKKDSCSAFFTLYTANLECLQALRICECNIFNINTLSCSLARLH